MTTMLDPVTTMQVRIRFTGTPSAETFHMIPRECARFHEDWKAYLAGTGASGGSYATEEAEQPLVIVLNFQTIAYIEPGKIY
jgi:hypothetical protein